MAQVQIGISLPFILSSKKSMSTRKSLHNNDRKCIFLD